MLYYYIDYTMNDKKEFTETLREIKEQLRPYADEHPDVIADLDKQIGNHIETIAKKGNKTQVRKIKQEVIDYLNSIKTKLQDQNMAPNFIKEIEEFINQIQSKMDSRKTPIVADNSMTEANTMPDLNTISEDSSMAENSMPDLNTISEDASTAENSMPELTSIPEEKEETDLAPIMGTGGKKTKKRRHRKYKTKKRISKRRMNKKRKTKKR
jgi:hypothetical protein